MKKNKDKVDKFPKDKKVKKAHSVFLITLNSNKNFNDTETTDFESDIREIFKTNFFNILQDRRTDVIFTKDLIDNYKIQYSIEKGNIAKKTHSHILIEIDHHGILMINKPLITAYFKKKYGTNIYMNIIPRGNNVKNMEDYIFKNQKFQEL